MAESDGNPAASSTRKRRSDGERSRDAILREASRLATVEGLEGLTIARLASAVGMSKSGLFAHFGSKEELQLATVALAREVFHEQVVDPSEAAPTALERLRLLCESFLVHLERGVYPGGCFFASAVAELDTRSGPVRESVLEVEFDYLGRIQRAVEEAQAEGALDPSAEAEQIAFDLTAYLLLANAQLVLLGERGPADRARDAIQRRLQEAAPR